MKLLPLLAGSGMFLDIGANVGAWSAMAAKYFRRIHAFEPDDTHAALLKRILPSNVTVHAIALSDHEGMGSLTVPISEGRELTTRASLEPNANIGFEGRVCEVPLATLDSFDFHDVDLIKIDVEGHEAAVLDGGSKTIDRERPILIVEIEERHHPARSEGIIERLLSRDHVCCFVQNGNLNKFERGSIERLQASAGQGQSGLDPNEYVNNFVFFPQQRIRQIELVKNLLAGQASSD
jgi:FkbM family methyltransferase